MAFSLRQLRYFSAIAEHGSISGAAQVLVISQSSVTDALRDLEAELGYQLAERHSRGIELTLKGHQFLRHAHRILADVADARRALGEDESRISGRLALGVTRLVAGYVLPELLGRFRRACPLVEIEIVEDASDYLEHLLIGGELDVAVMVLPQSASSASLRLRTIATSSYRAWLPLGHPVSGLETVTLKGLGTAPHIMLEVDEVAETLERLWRRAGLNPRVAFRTGSVEAVRSLVAQGVGIAVMPDLIYRPWSLEGDRIEARSIVDDLPAIEIVVAWRRGSPLSAAATGFIDLSATWAAVARARGPRA